MNPDVVGNYDSINPETHTNEAAEFFRNGDFTIVILSNPTFSVLEAFSMLCWQSKVPLINLRSCGLLGYMRIQLREQYVMASPSELYDLRLANTFPELVVCKLRNYEYYLMNYRNIVMVSIWKIWIR